MSFINNLLQSRYLKTCAAYAIAMGSSVAIKMSLVIVMAIVFGLSDSEKFSTYFSFALTADFSAILASYISHNFLRSRTSSLFAFFLAALGGGILIYSISLKELNIFYLSLAMLAIALGIIRYNLMVISNDYLKVEFKEHHNEYGSLMHSMTTIMSFFIVFIGGSIIRISTVYVISIPVFLIFVSFLIFFFSQRVYINEEIEQLIEKIKLGRYRIKKFISFIFLIISSVFISYYFIIFSNFNAVKNIPALFVVSFYIYLLIRANKNKEERGPIILAMSVALIVVMYLGMERQRDMTIALFLKRNISLQIFHYTFTPLQINALYQLSTIFISIVFVRYKIHSKFNHKSVAYTCMMLSSFAFFSLFLSCYFANENGFANFYLYLVCLVVMSGCNVLIITKFIEICRLMPESLKSVISSFMIMNMGIAFYVAKIYSNFIAIDSNNYDKFHSLAVYKNGFFKIFVINFIFTILIFIFFNLKKKIKKTSLVKEEEKVKVIFQ